MKKIKLLFIMFISLFVINVKADMGPPSISTHKVMVTNKEGTYCYENGNKTDKLIPYGTMLEVSMDIQGSYIYVHNNDYDCDVKYSDVSAKIQSFDLKTEGVEKIEPVKAVILANNGLNMRKGPSITYSKIITVPQYAVVTLQYRSGTYWFYAEYNGTSGWITGMNGYFGVENKNILYSYKETKIYNYNNKTVLGKIPANTEITDYLELFNRTGNQYYVIYNGIKGYIIDDMYYKTVKPGKIKLIQDFDVTDENGKLVKKITANQELEYNMLNLYSLYIKEKNIELPRSKDIYEDIVKADVAIKKSGYIGEGLFGEKKELPQEKENIDIIQETNNKENSGKTSTETIIIICLLAGILLALTALVIIKIINSKKNKIDINIKNNKEE